LAGILEEDIDVDIVAGHILEVPSSILASRIEVAAAGLAGTC